MASSVTDCRMAASLKHLQTVVCEDQHVPAKIAESVAALHAMNNKNDDAGLAATFLGLGQGKVFLKSAHSKSTQAQKEVVHLSDLISHTEEAEQFINQLPRCGSPEFQWHKALDIGVNIHNALIEAIPKTGGAVSGKTVLTDVKKKLGEYVTTIAKAFILGPVQKWFHDTMCEWSQHTAIASVPDIAMDRWTSMSTSKHLLSNASQLCVHVVTTSSLIHQIAETMKLSMTADVSKSVTLLAKLVTDVVGFKKTHWLELRKLVLVDEKGDVSFTAVHEQVISRSLVEAVAKEITVIGHSLSSMMSKVRAASTLLFVSFCLMELNINHKS